MRTFLRFTAIAALAGAMATSCVPADPATFTNPKDCVAAGHEWEIDAEAPNGVCETD